MLLSNLGKWPSTVSGFSEYRLSDEASRLEVLKETFRSASCFVAPRLQRPFEALITSVDAFIRALRIFKCSIDSRQLASVGTVERVLADDRHPSFLGVTRDVQDAQPPFFSFFAWSSIQCRFDHKERP